MRVYVNSVICILRNSYLVKILCLILNYKFILYYSNTSFEENSEQKIQLEPPVINGDSSVEQNSETKIELEPLVNNNDTSAMQNDETIIKLKPLANENNTSVVPNGESKTQLEPLVKKEFKLSPDAVPFSIKKLPRQKEKPVEYDLLKEVKTLKPKPKPNKTLELFFESIKVDLENFTIQDVDKVKLCILTCVSKHRSMYSEFTEVSSVNVKIDSESDIPTEPPCLNSAGEKCVKSEEHISLHNVLLEIQELKKELTTASTSLDYFFKSVTADIEDFCTHAIDQIKLDILKCVSDVKAQYSKHKVSKSRVGNATSNGLQTAVRNNRPRPSPPQECLMYYNVPMPQYYNLHSHNPHSYF